MSSSYIDPQVLALKLAKEVEKRLGNTNPQTEKLINNEIHALLNTKKSYLEENTQFSRVVIYANGKNNTGIVSSISNVVSDLNGDIRDLSQSIVAHYFTLLFIVNFPINSSQKIDFEVIRDRLKQVGEEMNIHVVVMHDDILSVMHDV